MNKKIDFGLLQKEVKDGNVRISQHPVHKSLYLFKYTQECVYSRKWNDINKMCRGLVVDRDTNEIISWPFEKFFNYDELDAIGLKIPTNLPYKIYEKLDGSLIIVSKYKGDIIINTPGSFESYQCELAKEIINREEYEFPLEGFTYCFELIHPENRIVVDYGSKNGLYLLMVRENQTGMEHPITNYTPYYYLCDENYDFTFNDVLSERKKQQFINAEGFVIRFDNGFRVKVKYDEYFRIHKLFSNVNEKYVWENLMEGNDIRKIIENCPDEFFQTVDEMVNKFQNDFNNIKNEYKLAFNHITYDLMFDKPLDIVRKKLKDKELRKQFAKKAKEYEYPGILFSMADNENVDKVIWNILKPR